MIRSLLAILISLISLVCHSQNTKNFNGPYGAFLIGIQNNFAGALIDDLDVLAQESSFVVEFSGGYRLQLLRERVTLGAEYLFGLIDGDLSTKDPRYGFEVNYKNDTQTGVAINVGFVFGNQHQWHSFVTFGRGSRKFEIDFTDQGGTSHNQIDEQNFDRIGFGLERVIVSKFTARFNISKIKVDFGNLQTTQDVEDKLDYNLALIYQF